MPHIYMPSSGPDAWRQVLAKPDLQWATGFSARTLAHCWEAAAGGPPPEIAALLEPLVGPTQILIALPEHKVRLPGGRRESQCDVFALLRARDQVIACAIEGKVDEPFGPTLDEWLSEPTPGKLERLRYICGVLGLAEKLDGTLRYQLLHRTASAVIEGERFMTEASAMFVHSFSRQARWFDDYLRFVNLFGVSGGNAATTIALPSGKALHLGWAAGDPSFSRLDPFSSRLAQSPDRSVNAGSP